MSAMLVRRGAPLLLMLGCIVSLLASCGLHSGADVLAFMRGGALWIIQSDGTSPMLIASGGIASFAWSPDHHQFVVRFGSNTVPQPPASTLGAPDSPSNLGIVSVNGGAALQITPQASGVLRSDAWWDQNGNRLLYRERLDASGQPPTYYVSQADQPVGIARKPIFAAATIPAVAPDGQQIAVIDGSGNVRLGTPNVLGAIVATGALSTLPNTNRLARILWRPHSSDLLYEVAATDGISLVLRAPSHGAHTIATVPALLDVAFSPDGASLLVRTPTEFRLYTIASPNVPAMTWAETDSTALPWWSPDSHAILVQDATGWRHVDVTRHIIRPVLALGGQPGASVNLATIPDWHPAASSPYSPDGSQIVVAAPAGSTWLGSPLPSPHNSDAGLYVAAFPSDNPGVATLIDSGADYAPGWSYLDPSTAFLVAS